PRRDDVLRHWFCCGSCGAAISKKFEWKVFTEGETLESLGAPGLLKVGSDVFAVAEAQCKKGEDIIFTGILSELLTETEDVEQKEVMKDAKKKTQFLEKEGSGGNKVDVSRPTIVVKENDIYMIAGTYSSNPADGCQDGADVATLKLLLVKGQVSDEENKKIGWNDAHALPCTFLNQEHKSWTRLTGGGGSGVKMDDGTVVFPVEGTKKGDARNDEKAVSLIIHSLKDTKSWVLSKGTSDGGCSAPSVVEWEDKKIIMMTACDDGRRRVYESGDKGESWTEALGTLSLVWGNKKGEKVEIVGSGLITATVGEDKRKVMLVTLPVYSKEKDKGGNEEKSELHLWLTDNTHIVDIGPVSGDDDAAASSLLYKSGDNNKGKKEELIALYEKKKDGEDTTSPGMVSVRLTEQLQRVKEVLATWKNVDERVSKLCTTLLAQKVTSPNTACNTVKVTDGLVGFLSGKFFGDTWRDEYLGVNATAKGNVRAEKEDNGVTFMGRVGAVARWRAGGESAVPLCELQLHSCGDGVHPRGADEGDTPIPLMGMRVKINGDENPVLLGLSYNNREKKCILVCSGGTNSEDQSVTLEVRDNEPYGHCATERQPGLRVRRWSACIGRCTMRSVKYEFERNLPLLHWRGWKQHRQHRDPRSGCDCEERPAVQPPVGCRGD
ncbi:trans-sialidase, partial [Trypanosoma cruzi]